MIELQNIKFSQQDYTQILIFLSMKSKHTCILLPQHLFSEKTVLREGGKGVKQKVEKRP